MILPLWMTSVGLETASASDCTIDGRSAAIEAKQAGFLFDVQKESGDGFCEQGPDNPWFMASATASSSIVCKVSLFGSRALDNSWDVRRITLTGTAIHDRHDPTTGSHLANTSFTFKADPSGDSKVFLKEVVLAGPSCKNWKDAFTSSVPMPTP